MAKMNGRYNPRDVRTVTADASAPGGTAEQQHRAAQTLASAARGSQQVRGGGRDRGPVPRRVSVAGCGAKRR